MKQFLLIFALALSRIASGQVHGQFVTAGGEPIPFVNISLLRQTDSSVAQTTLTDSAGNYRLTVVPGQYILQATHVGHQPWSGAVVVSGLSGADLGRLVLAEEKQQLGQVVVRAGRPAVQQSIEGTVVNVQNSMMSKGNTVLDVLGRSPGVILDQRNNSISLNGKEGVTVLIDGKMMHLPEDEVVNLLRGMSADNVDKIELLTAPPSRYDASGNAGMINIVLKKNKRLGTTGSFSMNGGYGYYEKGGASVNFDHNTGRTDWYGSYSFLHDHNYSGFFAGGSSNNLALGGPINFTFHDTNSFVNNNHNVLLGFEQKLRGRFTLGASVAYNNSTTTSVTHNFGVYVIPPDSALAFSGLIHGRSHWDNTIVSLTAEKEWKKSGKLGMGLDLLDYTNSRPSNVQGSFVDGHGTEVGVTGDSLFAPANHGFSTTTIKVWVGKIDYRVALNDRWRLEAGVKGDYTKSSSQSGIESLIAGDWVTSAASTNSIKMREAIGAGYASMHVVINDKLTMDAGMRYEYSDTRLTDVTTGAPVVHRPLGELFPSLLLTRRMGGNGQLQLSFTRRITRPSYKDLSSFIGYNDPFSVFTGNPQLKPTLTDNLKLGYVYHGYSLSVLLSRDDDAIFRGALTAQPGSQLVYIRPVNMSFQNSLTVEASLPFTVNDWWTMSYGFVGGWRQYKIGYLPMSSPKTWFGYSATYRENFKLPARFSAELSGFYNSQSFDGTNRVKGFGEVNIGVKKELNGNGGSLQLTVTDAFRMMNIKGWTGDVVKDAFNTHSYISWDAETRRMPIFRLTYSRSFGSGVKSAPKEERAGEEKERIK